VRQELAFYNVGCQEPRGARRVVVPFRRLLRRVLRPIFVRQDLEHISQRQFHLAEQLQGSVALGWDYVATVRRLAALEDRVEALTLRAEGPSGEGTSIRFPMQGGPEADALPDARVG
jgi:hypothetical protein